MMTNALLHTGKGWGMPSSKCCNTMGKIGRIVMLPQYKIESVVMLEGKGTLHKENLDRFNKVDFNIVNNSRVYEQK